MPFDEDKFSKYTEWTLYKKCPCCGTENSYVEEYVMDIKRISEDQSFVDAMIKLHDENPIEYELKMQQFKATKQQQKVAEKQESSKPENQRKCQYCGCTEFTPVKKNWSFLTGFMTNKTDLVCNNCGRKVAWYDK